MLEYDGVSWRLIPLANRSPPRSLAVDAEGPRTLKVWGPETFFIFAFATEDTFYVQQNDIGWMRVDGDSLVKAPGDEMFHRRVIAVAPQDEAAYFFVSLDGGEIFRCLIEGAAGWTCTAFSPGVDDLLAEFQPRGTGDRRLIARLTTMDAVKPQGYTMKWSSLSSG